jgi:hypothetical protein
MLQVRRATSAANQAALCRAGGLQVGKPPRDAFASRRRDFALAQPAAKCSDRHLEATTDGEGACEIRIAAGNEQRKGPEALLPGRPQIQAVDLLDLDDDHEKGEKNEGLNERKAQN